MDSGEQDKLFERLLARAVRQMMQPGGADCPDAETLAAYSEGALGEADAARCELHFSTCARCQQVLASLPAAEAMPVEESELVAALRVPAEATTEAPVYSLAAARASVATPQRGEAAPLERVQRRGGWLGWRWLVPVAAAGLATIVWVAVRPTVPDSPHSEVATRAPAQRSTEVAQGNPPQQPALAYKTESHPAPADASRQQKSPAAERELRLAAKDKSTADEFRDEKKGAAQALAAPGMAEKEVPSLDQAAPPRKAEADKLARDSRLRASAGMDAFGKAQPSPAPPPTAAAPSAANEAVAEMGKENKRPSALAKARAKADAPAMALRTAMARSAYVLIVTPLRTSFWRVGPGGSIEVSRDNNRTWQPQESGVSADLAAGSAPSEKICWVVGSAGTILRTTDGEHWEKIASPAALDWTEVKAEDAQTATIASGHARYFTTNGGRTWRAQP